MKFRQTFIFAFALYSTTSFAYQIKGVVNMSGDWQHQIFLATVDRLDDFYSANPENIINVTAIDDKGQFVIEGDNLPSHTQFYRLYLVKEEHSEFNACLFVGGDDHNYVHLLLNNESKVEIMADQNSYAPFGDYKMKSDQGNVLMKTLGNLVYPSYRFYEIKFPSELKFSQDKLNRDLIQFADTCSNALVALAALNNTDFNEYANSNQPVYKKTFENLKSVYPDHPYVKDLERKLVYHGAEVNMNSHQLWKILSGLLFLMSILFFFLWRKEKSKSEQIQVHENLGIQQLTNQEIKILEAIKSGKANKEIAADLFIELSTVKSHINKIYSKLGVKNRTEAINQANNQGI